MGETGGQRGVWAYASYSDMFIFIFCSPYKYIASTIIHLKPCTNLYGRSMN
uniref:Uncharacterized protein n=1 Tax=Arundo donax TaxID=35708 RepID=A0A0A9ERM6_ARUDO